MKNIPVFTTENGAASLILKEIPYTQTGYIKIQHTLEPEKLIGECVDFCKMVGAEQVFASNHPSLEAYPFHTALWRMTRSREGLPDTDAALFPVTEQIVGIWQSLYNRHMAQVPNFSYMTQKDAAEMLERGDGYFIHRDQMLLGIGIASGEQIDGVIAVQPGAGEQVVLALNHALSGEQVSLNVTSTNERAVRLYKRLGFIAVEELTRWYQVYKKPEM